MKVDKLFLFGILITLLCPTVVMAQEKAAERLGQVHFPVSCSAAAQKQFDRGLAALHSFWYEESLRVFTAVTETDASCAMGHWGIAMSIYYPLWVPPSQSTLQKGMNAIEKAKSIGAKTEREGAYVSAATSEIPVVFLLVVDPVAEGFVKSVSRPGGNMTGFGGPGDIPGKQIELFKEVVPSLRRLLTLLDPKDPVAQRSMVEVRTTAENFKLLLAEREAVTQADIARIFSSLKPGDVDGVFIVSPNLRTKFPSLILRLASEKRLPLTIHRKELVEQGALFSYAHDLASVGPPAAEYIDRIFKGAKPGDLPFQEPPRFEFVVNLKTANQIGLIIPPNVLSRADKVIR